MLTGRHARRWLGAILFALALPHADPEGLIQCVRADGSRSFEFACGCVEEEASCSCGQCGCVTAEQDFSGTRWSAESDGCSDFTMSLSVAPLRAGLNAPASQILQPAVAADLTVNIQDARPTRNAIWLAERYCGPPDRPGLNTFAVLRI